MSPHIHRIRARLGLVACVVTLLAVPAAATASYTAGDSPTSPGAAIGRANGPASIPFDHAARTVAQAVPGHDGGRTLPIVLSAVALGVAITGTGYSALRTRLLVRGA